VQLRQRVLLTLSEVVLTAAFGEQRRPKRVHWQSPPVY
jgi:hypothetical protein